MVSVWTGIFLTLGLLPGTGTAGSAGRRGESFAELPGWFPRPLGHFHSRDQTTNEQEEWTGCTAPVFPVSPLQQMLWFPL